MLFPTHLAAAALASRVGRLAPGWLVVGAALPDLVDKPLGLLGVTALFHSVGHSVLFLLVVGPLAFLNRAGVAVAVGWASHLLLDAVHVVVNGRPGDAVFLAWPALVPATPLDIPPGSFVLYYLWSPSFYLELVVWAVLAAVAVSERATIARAIGRVLGRRT